MLRNKLASILFYIIFLLSIFSNFYFFFKLNPTFSNKNLIKDKVIKIIDGDTIDIESGERIRFYETNAPEYPKDCLGIDSKARLEDLLLNKSIYYKKIGKDNFGRTLAYVYLNKLLINEIMIEEGLAYFEKGKTSTKNSLSFEKAEERAKAVKRGVWSEYCETKKEGCLIKGNYRADNNTRIYHTPDCYNYDRITIKPGSSDRWFCTEIEAKNFGFRKSKDCPN